VDSTFDKTSGDNPEQMSVLKSRSLPKMRQAPDGFEQRLLARARRAGLAQGDRLLVGFSGGRDSLALAAALRRVQAVLGIEPTLVHVDHRLRATSGDDARRVSALATALGLAVRVRAVPEVPTEVHPGVGIEEAARRERYRILCAEASALGVRAVATAHQRSDQAETVLLHLLRGGGVHGAAAMSEWSRLRATAAAKDISPDDGTWLWRPFLDESRAEIDAYLGKWGLSPIDDPSNADLTLRRNALRLEVLPLLEARFAGATAALARYASLAAEDDRLLEELAEVARADCVDPGGLLDAARLNGLPLALRRRVIRQWLGQMTGSTSFTAERTEAMLELAQRKTGGRVEIGEGWTVHRQRGMLRVERLSPGRDR
jgi:tRNA(Ile)-lysidine synthase